MKNKQGYFKPQSKSEEKMKFNKGFQPKAPAESISKPPAKGSSVQSSNQNKK